MDPVCDGAVVEWAGVSALSRKTWGVDPQQRRPQFQSTEEHVFTLRRSENPKKLTPRRGGNKQLKKFIVDCILLYTVK